MTATVLGKSSVSEGCKDIASTVKPAYNGHPRDWPILTVIEGYRSVQVKYEKGKLFVDVIFVSDN